MFRHLLRATVALVVLSGSLFCLPSPRSRTGASWAAAGAGGFLSDPFKFYYAFYLPNQQMQAMRPTPMDSINQAMAGAGNITHRPTVAACTTRFRLTDGRELRSSSPLLRSAG